MNTWLSTLLVCPRDHENLVRDGEVFKCPSNHHYPVVGDVPIMLLDEAEPTHGVCGQTLRAIGNSRRNIGNNRHAGSDDTIDPFVQDVIAATNGCLYKPLIGKLTRYPIPQLRLPDAADQVLLDIGCNWGRWCISAARKGYRPIGIDPSLEAIQSAIRVSHQLVARAEYLVADARHIPLAAASVDVVFSYSVLQHFSKLNVKASLREIRRVLKPSGVCMVQMPNMLGLRNMYHQIKRGFRAATEFEVRYWTPAELRQVFSEFIGPSVLSVDGYLGLGIQASDVDILPGRFRTVVRCSEVLRRMSEFISPMKQCADSIYVTSVRAHD